MTKIDEALAALGSAPFLGGRNIGAQLSLAKGLPAEKQVPYLLEAIIATCEALHEAADSLRAVSADAAKLAELRQSVRIVRAVLQL